MVTMDDADACSGGFLCPEGSSNDQVEECPAGYSCVSGTPFEIPCNRDQFQDEAGQNNCKDCGAGDSCLVQRSGFLDTSHLSAR